MLSLNTLMLNSDLYTEEYFRQDDVCRLCWNKNAVREISSVTSEIKDYKNEMVGKILYCLGIEVLPNTYPKNACKDCCNNVEKFCQFKNFCNETDRKLHEILQRNDLDASLIPDIKIEKHDEVNLQQEEVFNIDITKTDSLDSFLDILDHTDVSSEQTDLENTNKELLSTSKKKYKPKRSPTYCNICRSDFGTLEKFALHNSTCHGVEDNEFKCFGCEKRFKNRKTRLGHEINFCKGLKDGYKCVICERYLPKRRLYEAHMRDHRDNIAVVLPEDIFKCTKCSELFKSKEELKSHMEVHKTEKKLFICESCGRVFTRQDYLHKHKLIHTGVKKHVCPHCGFRATQRSSLTLHIRKHTGERPYSCDVCPQRCISSANLRAHRRRHLGVKKYECTICSKKFGYKISLEEHVSSTHERAQPHPCPHCGATYTRLRGLRRHLLAKHGKDKKDPQEKRETEQIYVKIVTDTVKDGEFVLKTHDQVYVV